MLSFVLKRMKRYQGWIQPVVRHPMLKSSLRRTSLYLAAIVALHTAAMIVFEGMGAVDGLWVTVTTLTTVGYGDLSAATAAGRLSTFVLLYVGGIFIVAKLAGDYFEYRSARRDAMTRGNWSWDDLADHIVIVGSKRESLPHLTRLVDELLGDPRTRGRDIVLVTSFWSDGLPLPLEERGVRFVRGNGADPLVLSRAAVAAADIVVILAWEEDEPLSDGHTFDVLHRIRESTTKATVLAECVDDANRERLAAAGAKFVVRPVRAYPEMIVGAIADPGSSEILENLFTDAEEHIRCINGDVEGRWLDIVSRSVGEDLGIPVGYRERGTGKVRVAPPPDTVIDGDALYLVSRHQE